MRFGFTLPNNWGLADPADVVALAPLAEAVGYDSVWVNHHLLNVGYVADRLGDRPYYDALTTLTWVAALTQRVRLGTSVLVVPYLSPFVTAKAVATLDQLSGGRVNCGVGVGSLPEEHAAVSPVPYGARGRYADEFLQVMVALWTEDRPAFAGGFFRFESTPASPRPRQQPHPPLVVGGNTAAALRRAARFGQGWHALAPSPEGMAQRLERLDEQLAAAGRARADLVVSLRADLHLSDEPAPADARGAGLRGDAAQLVDRLGRYAEIGVEEVVVSVPSPDPDHQRHQLEAFAEAVIPQLRT